MNLEYLSNFIVLVDFMNFTKAAEYLHIAQSTLSKQISALESSFETTLLIRTNRHIEVTASGKYLYETGKLLLTQVQDIKRRMRSFEDLADGAISISSITVDCPAIFDAINAFRSAFPKAMVYLGHDLLLSTIKNVSCGKADFGITADYIIRGGTHLDARQAMESMSTLPLKQEPFYLLVSEKAADDFGGVAALGQLPPDIPVLIEASLRSYLFLDPGCAQLLSGLNLQPLGTDYSDWESMVLQVKSGFCTALIPRPLSHDGCTLLPISDPGFHYGIFAFWKSNTLNPLIPKFVAYLREEVQEQEPDV